MAQKTVTDEPLEAYEGKLQEEAQVVTSAIATSKIFFGKAVTRSKTVGVGDIVPAVIPYNGTDKFEGFAIADVTKEPGDDTYGAYAAKETVSILKKGRIWVVTGDAITNLTNAVFVRNASGGATPALAQGAVRSTAATGYVSLTAIANVKFVAYRVINSVKFALIAINEG